MTDQASDVELPPYLLHFLNETLGTDAVSALKVKALKSAQQQVWILGDVSSPEDSLPSKWRTALDLGNNRLIARQWRASSCWWNLNRNQHPRDAGGSSSHEVEVLARSEVAGYRLASKALDKIHIPSVLHFSLDDNNREAASAEEPWAILAYVGPESTLFGDERKPDSSWLDGMIKARFEFGFDEPHPRWGRVPEDECVKYTLSVLRQVTCPLHWYFRENRNDLDDDIKVLRGASSMENSGFTYPSMVQLYREEQQKMKRNTVDSNDNKLNAAIELLEKAINKLSQQQPYSDEPLRPFVLCHMDCQPQNMLFAQQLNGNGGMLTQSISSVFDWEEAALADPRFELLLLCRKVCANRDQAEHIWKTYGQEFQGHLSLGPLGPWLALETVHSVTSLLLQSMDLLGGGRNPWESKPDMWGKIQREIQRLVVEQSWDFCDIPEFQ